MNRSTWRGSWQRLRLQGAPVLVVLLAVLLLWVAGAVAMNAQGAIERVLPSDEPWTWQDLLAATLSMERPVLPAPHQVAADLWASLTGWPIDSLILCPTSRATISVVPPAGNGTMILIGLDG